MSDGELYDFADAPPPKGAPSATSIAAQALPRRTSGGQSPSRAPGQATGNAERQSPPSAAVRLRSLWPIYGILIAIGVGGMIGRILALDSVNLQALEARRLDEAEKKVAARAVALRQKGVSEETIAAETARVRAALTQSAKITRPFLSGNDRSRWCTVRALVEPEMRVEGAPYSIDKVIQDPDWDTIDKVKHDGHLFSSKPPLFATILAGQYWIIYRLTGATLGTHPYEIARGMLIVNNVLPLAVYFIVLALFAERFAVTDFARVFMVAAGIFATFLTTFAIAINNHLPAAICAAIALYAGVRIWIDRRTGLGYFFLCGLFAAMTVTFELPGAAFAAALAAALLWRAPRATLLAFVPPALLVAAAYLGTNWISHGTLEPAYAHRTGAQSWYDYTYERGGHTIESYWRNPVGVDRGEPSLGVYALHSLVGHHGVFSLTPIWLLSVVGLAIWLMRPPERGLRGLALFIGALSFIVLVFYLKQPLENRNYGGVSAGLRWSFWFAPLWLVAMLPALDAAARHVLARWFSLALLALAALSVSYPTWNPWTHPWLMTFFQYLGWITVP